jgi:hypothetical protein
MQTLPAPIRSATADYPKAAQAVFAEIRSMIFEEAGRLNAGPLEETLKWGEPAYLTSVSKSGSTIRMAWKPSDPDNCNIYLNCNTDLVARITTEFPDVFRTTGARCIHIGLGDDIPDLPLRGALSRALTYHRDK